MKLKWMGTSGFQVDTGNEIFLIDPYLSRNPLASPVQNLQSSNVAGAGRIFISHGHFDHLSDVPAIMAQGSAVVYCSNIAAMTLERKGVDKERIHTISEDGFSADFGKFQVQAFFSRHVKFDIPLVIGTMRRIGTDFGRLSCMAFPYPKGQVLSWRFTVKGYNMHHFGSAGSTLQEMERLAVLPLDMLLMPLQGHTHICDIAFEYVRALKPKLVIPHHHDDFYPPISTAVDIDPFVNKVRRQCPGTEVRVMSINQTLTL